MSFKLEKIDRLPTRKFPAKSKLYDEIVKGAMKGDTGIFKVSVPNKKVGTVYQALSKRVKGNKSLKLHMRSNVVYLEKL